MKAFIDSEGCISCGLCASICENVFGMSDDGPATVLVDVIDKDDESDVLEAKESCPVSVISVE